MPTSMIFLTYIILYLISFGVLRAFVFNDDVEDGMEIMAAAVAALLFPIVIPIILIEGLIRKLSKPS